MSLPQPKPGVMNLPIYVPGKSAVKGVSRIIKLSSNEAALGPSPKAIAAYMEIAGSLDRYPEGDAGDMREALGKAHGLDPARIMCGSGSDELILLLCRAYAGPGDEVVHSRHGFLMYDINTRSVGATPVAAPERNLTADVDAMLAAVTERTKIVFLANPNNPTGTYIPASEVARLRAGLREDVVLALDDAYAEYVEAADYQNGTHLASTTPNTITLRTLSKIYGLAALRIGWAFGPAAIIDALQRLRSPFNVSRAALAAGVAAVGDEAHLVKQRAHNSKWQRIALQRLRGLGLTVPDTQGNFVLPRFPTEPGFTAADADAFLQSKGIVVRRVDGYGLSEYLRITLGTDEEMEITLDVLTEFMGRPRG
jgi:histidinol-phosphate aminotransferase